MKIINSFILKMKDNSPLAKKIKSPNVMVDAKKIKKVIV